MDSSNRIEGRMLLPDGLELTPEEQIETTRESPLEKAVVVKEYLDALRELGTHCKSLIDELHTFKGRITYQATHKTGFISLVRFLINKSKWFIETQKNQENLNAVIASKHDILIRLESSMREHIDGNQSKDIDDIKESIKNIVEDHPLQATDAQIDDIIRAIENVTREIEQEAPK